MTIECLVTQLKTRMCIIEAYSKIVSISSKEGQSYIMLWSQARRI